MKLFIALLLGFFSSLSISLSRDYIHVVGSSTVFPFVTIISEEFARTYRTKTPVVESTGTGAGFKLFCISGDSDNTPDITLASRRINNTELDFCKMNGVNDDDIIEFKLGDDAVVMVSNKNISSQDFSRSDLFNALSYYVENDELSVARNNYKYWNDIDSRLIGTPIKIYGPLKSSGTFESIVNVILKPICMSSRAFKIRFTQEELSKVCSITRDDNAFVEVGSDENTIVQRVMKLDNSFGIMGYSFVARNSDDLTVHSIDTVYPSEENIRNELYPLSRPLYMYVRKSRINKVNMLGVFLREVFSDDAMGQFGYLTGIGLVPSGNSSANRDLINSIDKNYNKRTLDRKPSMKKDIKKQSETGHEIPKESK